MRDKETDEITHVITVGEDVTMSVEAIHAAGRAEKLAAIGRLAAGVVHEINNPLATISACSESLESRVAEGVFGESEEVADLSEYLRLIRSEAFRCKSITNGLLDFSRRRTVNRFSIDLSEVLKSSARLVAHQKRGENIEIKLELPDEMPPVEKEVLRLVQRVAPSDTSVLITGESGTGKELIAQALHRLSRRNEKTFIDLNCAALQDSLLESELFGHEAGAFSGARARKLGLFEIADSGTLFLDEVMEMPAQLQSKLLRALETRTFFRVGGVKKVEVDVRLVAATNRNAAQSVTDGTFRADLLYRINSFEIHIPPLRQRREDIEPLAQYLLNKIAGANAPELTPQAIDALSSFSWTGNVRQLRNCLERAVLLSDNDKITPRELPPEIAFRTERPSVSVSYGTQRAETVGSFQNTTSNNLRDSERQQIIVALEKTGWHRGKTAELLGISPSTLYRRLREYDLDVR
ncbi:MAG: sigma 54-interacting transcriptional regulator [Verrucomicrobiota bacterium]|nr:sigma 54-interacting transcriptional regulator [Verrucomicrobiota bacterium]